MGFKRSASQAFESVKVAVRCRPFSAAELGAGNGSVVQCNTRHRQVQLQQAGTVPKEFTFDSVLGPASSQEEVYVALGKPIVASVLSGYNATVFAYGQSGTGKSHTVHGTATEPEQAGLVPRAVQDIFQAVADSSQQHLVRISYLEVYNEEVRDLLSRSSGTQLRIHEDAEGFAYVKGLTWKTAGCEADVFSALQAGNKQRVVGATALNQDSSRSHSIFCIAVEHTVPRGEQAGEGVRMGKLNLVDLAGSERQSKAQTQGERFREATRINLSLSALGNVISALVDGTGHVPYRVSKLTRLLQDSLGGNTKTVMIATVSPAACHSDETLSTLRYADRAKRIKNCPIVNEDPKDAMLKQYQDEIARLRAQLDATTPMAAALPAELSMTQLQQEPSTASLDMDPAEEAAMRAEIEAELQAKWMTVNAEALAQIKEQARQEAANARAASQHAAEAAFEEAACEAEEAEAEALLQQEEEAAKEAEAAAAEATRQLKAQRQVTDATRQQQAALQAQREHLERKLAVMERQLLGGQPGTSAPADPDKLAKQQRLLQYHAELGQRSTAQVAALQEAQERLQSSVSSLQGELNNVALQVEAAQAAAAAASAAAATRRAAQATEIAQLREHLRQAESFLAQKARQVEAQVPAHLSHKIAQQALWDPAASSWSNGGLAPQTKSSKDGAQAPPPNAVAAARAAYLQQRMRAMASKA